MVGSLQNVLSSRGEEIFGNMSMQTLIKNKLRKTWLVLVDPEGKLLQPGKIAGQGPVMTEAFLAEI